MRASAPFSAIFVLSSRNVGESSVPEIVNETVAVSVPSWPSLTL